MDLILQEVKNSLKQLVNTESFQYLSVEQKDDFVNRNYLIFEREFPNFLISKVPLEIISDPEKLKLFAENLNYEDLTKEFIEIYKTQVK